MEMILITYKRNVGKLPLFSKIIDIDFYDGPTEAISKLADTEKWFIGSLVYFDIKNDQRIFSLLELDEHWLLQITSILEEYKSGKMEHYKALKEKIKNLYKTYSGKVFLFKSDQLNAKNYEIAQIPIKHLKYYNDVEDVIEQKEESKMQWIGFF